MQKTKEELNHIRYKKRWTLILLALFLFLYIPSLYAWVKGEDIRTDIINYGSIEDFISVDAYIIREEELIRAPFAGKCVLNYADGMKVPAGSKIATIYRENIDDLTKRIEEIEKKIIEAQNEKYENDMVFLNDIKKINDEIASKARRLVSMNISGNISKASEVKKEIDESIKKKATITGSLSTSDVYIQMLKDQKAESEKILETKKQDVISRTTGIVSYVIDGVEEYFNKNSIYRLTSKDIENLNLKKNIFKNGENVEFNKIYAKVINNVEGYLVAVLDKNTKIDFYIDESVKIRINEKINDINSKIIDGQIYYMSREEGTGKTIIAVRINKGLDELAGSRKVGADIIKKVINGLKVPVTALKNIDEKNNEAEIFIVNHNYTVLRKVKLLGKNSEYAIIDSIDDKDKGTAGAYDEFVISAKNVEEGRIVRQ